MDPTVTDCERQPLLNGAPTATEDRANPRPPPLSESRRFLASTLLLLTVYWTWMQITAYIRPYYPDFNRPPEPITHPGEHIAWLPCGTLANRTLECANLTVPMDHFAPASHTPDLTKNFTIPLLRLRSPDPNVTTNLLLNPGGPGGSGTAQLHRRGAQLAALVGDGFHLLGFDPRGVNQSRPLASCYPTPQSRQELSAVRDKKVAEDSGE
jgi:hypothetical protein